MPVWSRPVRTAVLAAVCATSGVCGQQYAAQAPATGEATSPSDVIADSLASQPPYPNVAAAPTPAPVYAQPPPPPPPVASADGNSLAAAPNGGYAAAAPNGGYAAAAPNGGYAAAAPNGGYAAAAPNGGYAPNAGYAAPTGNLRAPAPAGDAGTWASTAGTQQVVTDANGDAGAYGDASSGGEYAVDYNQETWTTTTVAPSPPLFEIPGAPELPEGLEESTEQSIPSAPFEPLEADPVNGCSSRFTLPGRAPTHATDFNGAELPPVCFDGPSPSKDGKHHVWVIGDWGGVTEHPWNKTFAAPIPADHRNSKQFKAHHRPFVFGADDSAQMNVANQMRARVSKTEADYVLNVGDNFYWGGINVKCGSPPYMIQDVTKQWEKGFESVYTGPGIDGKQWLGVLGNHDYGGWMFVAGWDTMISYSWLQSHPSTNRWVTPAQYWSQKVRYDNFAVDYFFMDTNVFDTWEEHADAAHNICSLSHNPETGATCGVMGPVSPEECPAWFKRLWEAQVEWLKAGLEASQGDWQIIVTHFPPEGLWGGDTWKQYAEQYGIDLIVTGHRHRQEVHYMDELNPMMPTAYVVSGGGGGITSENTPTPDGQDDEYGFMDFTMTKEEIMIEAISHGGQIRSTTCVHKRQRGGASDHYDWVNSGKPSICDGIPAGPQPLPDRPAPNGFFGGQEAPAQAAAAEPATEPRIVAMVHKLEGMLHIR